MIVPGVVSVLKSLNDRLAATLEGILVFVVLKSRAEVVPGNIKLGGRILRLFAVCNVLGVKKTGKDALSTRA